MPAVGKAEVACGRERGNMGEYWIGLLTLSLLCAVMEILVPGEENGVAKHLHLLCAVCLLCVLVQPFGRLLTELRELPSRLGDWLTEAEEGAAEEYRQRWEQEKNDLEGGYAGQYAEELLREAVCEKFSLSTADCRLEIVWGEDGRTPEQVRVALSGQAIWCPTHELERFVQEMLDCPCTVWLE